MRLQIQKINLIINRTYFLKYSSLSSDLSNRSLGLGRGSQRRATLPILQKWLRDQVISAVSDQMKHIPSAQLPCSFHLSHQFKQIEGNWLLFTPLGRTHAETW